MRVATELGQRKGMEPWIWSWVTQGGPGLGGDWCARDGDMGFGWISPMEDGYAVNGEGLNWKRGGGGSEVDNMDLVTKIKAWTYGSCRCAGTGRR